jgi:4-amino-4-deoxy-L-arabinose transferase-like glycosyltransferase
VTILTATASPAARRAGAERALRFLEASHTRAVVVLLAISLAAFLPGFFGLQPMDRDEPRFAQASKQMLESGDFVNIRFQDEARNKKPVGIYWLQAAVVAAAESVGIPETHTTIGLYRLPSLVGALATVLLTYWAALAMVTRRRAFLAAAFMAASLLLGAEARLAKTDAVLAACCVAAMGALARAFFGRDGRTSTANALVFWVAIGLSVLIKGPIGPMIAAFAVAALSWRQRSARWLILLRPWLGLVIAALIVAPWFVAIAIETKGAFFAEAVGKDMLAKVGGGQERHWGPPGTYLVLFFVTFWPIAAFAAIAVPAVWRDRRSDVVAFLLAWIVPAWLLFEAVPTKLPHYVLPLYPAIAILTARALTAGHVEAGRRAARATILLLSLVPIAMLAAAAFAGIWLGDGVPFVSLPVIAIAALLALFAEFVFRRGNAVGASLVAVLAAVVASIAVFGLSHTMFRSLKLSPRLAEVARTLDCPGPRYATAGYREPSLVFLVGTDLALLDGASAAAFLAAAPCRMTFVEAREEKAFGDALVKNGAAPNLVTRVIGFNISNGRRLDIGVYANRP